MIFVHDLRASGVVRNTLAISRRISRRHEVLLVTRNDHGGLREETHGDSRWRPIALFGPGESGGFFRAAALLRRRLDAERPDVLLSTGNRGHWVARLATLGRTRPARLYRLSNSLDREGVGASGIRALGARLLAIDASQLLLVGRAIARMPQFAIARARGRAQMIPNGVDRERALRLAETPCPHPWLEDELPVVLGIGRLARQKDFPTLIRAAARAMRERPFRLIIVGKGSDAGVRALATLAAEEGIARHVLLPGETANVFAWLSRADAFVLPSRWEGSSNALLEALAVGVPTVATRQAGDAANVLGSGRFGLIVEAGDVDAMARAILRQLSPEAIRPGDRANDFSLDAVLDRYATAVDRVVARVRQADDAG